MARPEIWIGAVASLWLLLLMDENKERLIEV